MKPFLLLPLSLALLSGSLLSQVMPREQLIDAVREFKRFFKKYPKPAQRVEAVMSLESIDCPEAVDTPVAFEIAIDVLGDGTTDTIGLLAKVEGGEFIREAGTDSNPFDVSTETERTGVSFTVSMGGGGPTEPTEPTEPAGLPEPPAAVP